MAEALAQWGIPEFGVQRRERVDHLIGLFALKLAGKDIAEMRSPGVRHIVDDQQLAVANSA